MEEQLFTWEDCDQEGDILLCFYRCKLLVDIGEYKAGTSIRVIDMDYGKSVMNIYLEDGKKYDSYPLYVSVGNKIEAE